LPTRSKILSRITLERQISGEESETHFGSTRPVPAVGDWQLCGAVSAGRSVGADSELTMRSIQFQAVSTAHLPTAMTATQAETGAAVRSTAPGLLVSR